MTLHTSKKFIASALLLVLSFASLAWLTTRTSEGAGVPAVAAQSGNERSLNTGAASVSRVSAASTNDSSAADQTSFDDGYRAGYRDAQADLAARAEDGSYQPATVRRAYYSRPRAVRASTSRTVVARRGHSTRNMILRIAAPAAIGAGIGAIAGGKRGAGIGALLGGGGGAVYHLVKHGRR